MPKIAAENVEEHVRRQTTRILDIAGELFTTNGYRGTDLGGIAKRIGLARSSLYRYFPSKDHILVAVMQREMAPFAERIAQLDTRFPEPGARIDAWLDLQMELASGPCHAMMGMLGDMTELAEELREEIRELHVAPRRSLEAAVSDVLTGSGRDAKVVSAMIASMLESAAGIAMWSGDVDSVVPELKNSVRSVLARAV